MWWTLLPFVLVTAAVVLVPGFVINWASGFRPLTALGLAPLVSTGVVAAAAIAADTVGLPWGPLPIAALTVSLALIGLGFRRVVGRLAPEHGPVRVLLSGGERHDPGFGWPLVGWAVAALLLTWDALRLLGAPTNFSQTYDNIFHLNAVRWIVDHRNGSSLNLRMVTGDDPAAFYPSAWHDVASGALLTMGSADAVAATSALIIVTIAVVWPLSCLVLVRRLLRPDQLPVGTLATGVLVAAFTPLPFLLVRFGVLYPNLLGLCLLPAVLALGVAMLRLGDGPPWPVPAAVVATGLGMVALMLTHPNVALTVVSLLGSVMISFWALPTVVRALRQRRWNLGAWLRLGLFGAWGLAALAAYIFIRPPKAAMSWGPRRSYLDALIEATLVSPLEASVVVVSALLTIIGAVAVVWQRRNGWLLASHLVLCFLWVVAAARDYGRLRDYIVGPYYNDPYRLAAMLPVTALPLAVLGVVFLTDPLVAARGGGRPDRRVNTVALAAATALILIATTQFGGGKTRMLEWVHESYAITPASPLVDSDEYAVLRQVPSLVPVEDTIAVNPWNGSSMVYALTGRQTTATHVLYTPNQDKQVLIEHLDDVMTDPRVCPALLDLNVGWVLDFGNTRLINNENRAYPGWENLADSPGFEVAYRSGSAALYRVVACN